MISFRTAAKYALPGIFPGIIPPVIPTIHREVEKAVTAVKISPTIPIKKLSVGYYGFDKWKNSNLRDEGKLLWAKVWPTINDFELWHAYNFHYFPQKQANGFMQAWAGLPDSDKKSYAGELARILRRAFPHPSQIPTYMNSMNKDTSLWFSHQLFPEYIDLSYKKWIETDVDDFLSKSIAANLALTDPARRATNQAYVRKLLDNYASDDFLEKIDTVTAENTLSTYYQAELAEIESLTASINSKKIGKFMGMAAVGVFGIFLISRIGKKKA